MANWRRMRTVTTPDTTPRICAALDVVIGDSDFTNQDIGKALGVSGAAVGRWRRVAEPSRDHVAAIERLLGKPLGYVNTLAGYSESVAPDDIPALIRASGAYTDAWQRILLRVEQEASAGSRETREQQSSWAKLRRA